mgnify:CR=1 FL=1
MLHTQWSALYLDGESARALPHLRRAVELAPDGFSGRHRETGKWLRSVEILALDVSSSGIRQRLRDGRCVRYLLPEPVRWPRPHSATKVENARFQSNVPVVPSGWGKCMPGDLAD